MNDELTLLGIKLGMLDDTPQCDNYPHIYRAIPHKLVGADCNGDLVFGLTLKVVSEGNDYDSLREEWGNIQAEADIVMPEEGLIEGAYYASHTITTVSGQYGDDYEYQVHVRRVL